MTLAKAEVCGRVRLSIGPVSGVVFTLGDGWSTVWGALDLVCLCKRVVRYGVVRV